MTSVTPAEARDIVAALRTGVVPPSGLHHFATGLDPLMEAVGAELDEVASGRGRVKWIRGPYGSGKTFATRLLCCRARERGFVTAEVQISAVDTPLHRLEAVYRRALERLTTPEGREGAFRGLVDAWLYQIGDEVMRLRGITEADEAFPDAVEQRLEDELAQLSAVNPTFARVLRAYHRAMEASDFARAQGLLAWLGGDPAVGAGVKRPAGVKGEIDGPAALAFLRGVLQLARDTGRAGMVLVLDEVETVQQMRSDVREKALQSLRQLLDALLAGDLPGLYLVVTGTAQFFDGYKGIAGLQPLHDRVQTRFSADPRFDNLRAPQVRLAPFDAARLRQVGLKVRELYPAKHPERIRARLTDEVLARMVEAATAAFGGRVEIVPRLFLRELVDVMDRIDQYADYDPAVHADFAVDESALRPEELAARLGGRVAESADAEDRPEPPEAPTPRRLD